MKLKLLLAAAALALTASQGHAAVITYNGVTGFGSAPFSYGGGVAGSSFIPLTATTDCVATGLSCYNNPSNTTEYTFPVVAQNTTGGSLTFYTNTITDNQLFLQAGSASDAIIKFTAPKTGVYDISAVFSRIDTSNGAGDGSVVGVIGAGALGSPQALSNQTGSGYTFSGPVTLTAGSSLEFYQSSRGGTIFNDGTGLQLSVVAVPEPGTWALMFLGVAMTGMALRSHRKMTLAAAEA